MATHPIFVSTAVGDAQKPQPSKAEAAVPLRQRITQPKDPNVRFCLTLNGFVINYLRQKRETATTEELLEVARVNLPSLRRIDGSQYKPTFTRVFFGTLERCPAFKKTDDGWTIDEQEAESYKKDILRHIHRRLSRSSKKPPAEESKPSQESLTEKTEPSETSATEEPEDEPPTTKFRKLLQVFPGYESLLQEIASAQKV